VILNDRPFLSQACGVAIATFLQLGRSSVQLKHAPPTTEASNFRLHLVHTYPHYLAFGRQSTVVILIDWPFLPQRFGVAIASLLQLGLSSVQLKHVPPTTEASSIFYIHAKSSGNR
jgi:hypothetical protein